MLNSVFFLIISTVALILVHLIGKDGDRVFDERDVQFTIGEG